MDSRNKSKISSPFRALKKNRTWDSNLKTLLTLAILRDLMAFNQMRWRNLIQMWALLLSESERHQGNGTSRLAVWGRPRANTATSPTARGARGAPGLELWEERSCVMNNHFNNSMMIAQMAWDLKEYKKIWIHIVSILRACLPSKSKAAGTSGLARRWISSRIPSPVELVRVQPEKLQDHRDRRL